jgi:hypothetical protein
MSYDYVITIPENALYSLRIVDLEGNISYYMTPYSTTDFLQDASFFGSYDSAVVHLALLSEIQDASPSSDYPPGFVVDVITVFGETMNLKENT